MSSSPDLSPRARVLLAAGLVRTAWGLPRAPGDAAALGGTTVSLAAGLCGLVALALGRQPLGLLWAPARAARPAPEVARGLAVGDLCAAAYLGGLRRDDATVARVTEELAFRRALLGRPESVRLGSLGLWRSRSACGTWRSRATTAHQWRASSEPRWAGS
ncbi:MAG TPA: hypothetical protein VFU41_08445 [Gemmatimonadales bacterium]|nr:hypothetical protein [Gemmatimonadales bacterium]